VDAIFEEHPHDVMRFLQTRGVEKLAEFTENVSVWRRGAATWRRCGCCWRVQVTWTAQIPRRWARWRGRAGLRRRGCWSNTGPTPTPRTTWAALSCIKLDTVEKDKLWSRHGEFTPVMGGGGGGGDKEGGGGRAAEEAAGQLREVRRQLDRQEELLRQLCSRLGAQP
jgi:hypothetical protein